MLKCRSGSAQPPLIHEAPKEGKAGSRHGRRWGSGCAPATPALTALAPGARGWSLARTVPDAPAQGALRPYGVPFMSPSPGAAGASP
jgi:hypothetical protein